MYYNNITLRRLSADKNDNEPIPPGWFPETVEAEFTTREEAFLALQRIKEVVNIIATIKEKRKDWPGIEEWKKLLPEWLLNAFGPEYTKEEIEQFLKNKRQRVGWTLEDWQFYFKNIIWEWWDGKVEGNIVIIEILVDGHPFSIYELERLIELTGAKSIKVID